MMKILRKISQKLFSRDVVSEARLTPFLIYPFIKENKIEHLPFEIAIEDSSSRFQKQYKTLGETEKKQIKLFRKDIQTLNIFNDGKAGGDTHILTGLSNKDSLVVSKSINKIDRLVYRVYKPKVVKKTVSGKTIETITQKIVLESCIGHNANGQGNYLKDKALKNRIDKKRVIDPSTVKSNKKINKRESEKL